MNEVKRDKENKAKFIEGVDFYFENGLMVLTAHFLKKRGYCCDTVCRHCPYPGENENEIKAKTQNL